MTVTAANGVTFNVVFRDSPVYHKPMVEFYDSRQRGAKAWAEFGQYVAEYSLDTIAGHAPGVGLILYGGVPSWRIDGETMRHVVRRAQEIALSCAHPEDVKPGTRVVVSDGIVTVRGIKIDGDQCTLYFEEDQPPVTFHRSNTVELAQ